MRFLNIWLVIVSNLLSIVLPFPPADQVSLYNSALQFHNSGNIALAFQNYQLALDGHREFPEAHQNIALLYEHKGDLELAVYHHRMSVQFAESDSFRASATVNFFYASMRSGVKSDIELSDMLFLLEKAVLLAPHNLNVGLALGQLLNHMGKFEAALSSFQRVLVQDPQHFLALLNIGNYYFRRSDYSIAAHYYSQSEDRIPVNDLANRLLALSNLAQSLRQQGLLAEALHTVHKAYFVLSGVNMTARGTFRAVQTVEEMLVVSSIYSLQGLGCRWVGYDHLEAVLTAFVANHNSGSSSSGVSLSEVMDPYTVSLWTYASTALDRRACMKSCPSVPVHGARYETSATGGDKPNGTTSGHSAGVERPVRVGYLSYDWRDHPMGRLTARLVTTHNASRVASATFSFGPNDGSTERRFVQSNALEFHDLASTHSDWEASALLRSRALDVVVDLTAHTYNGRIAIAALKPAPLVIGYLGFAGTTGCTGFDYAMVDAMAVPPDLHGKAQYFSEQLLYLPHSYQANDLPLEVAPCSGDSRLHCRRERQLVAAAEWSEFGQLRSADAMSSPAVQWVCAFNAQKKIEPVSFAVWMGILRRVSSALLILLDIPADAKQQLLVSANHFGVSSSRIVFVGRQRWREHLFRSAACDLALDTFVYGAHTTASDLLWMHVPIVTLRSYGSNRMPSRVAAGISQSLTHFLPRGGDARSSLWDVSVLVAETVREYEDTAVRLLQTPSILAEMHRAIGFLTMRSPTFNKFLMQRNVERAYQSAVELRHITPSTDTLPHIIIPADAALSIGSEELSLQEARTELLAKVSSIAEQFSSLGCSPVSSTDLEVSLSALDDCLSLLQPRDSPCRIPATWSRVLALTRRLQLSFPELWAVEQLRLCGCLLESAAVDIPGEQLDAPHLKTASTDLMLTDDGAFTGEAGAQPAVTGSESDVSAETPSQGTLRCESQLSKSNLLADLFEIHNESSELPRTALSAGLSTLLGQYLRADFAAAMDVVADAQMALLAQDCEVEELLFRSLVPFMMRPLSFEALLVLARQSEHGSQLALELDKDISHIRGASSVSEWMAATSAVQWAQRSQVLAVHLLLFEALPQYLRLVGAWDAAAGMTCYTSRSGSNDAIAALLAQHGVCLSGSAAASRTNTLTAIFSLVSALFITALDHSSLLNAGLVLLEGGESEMGFLIASVATLKEQQRAFRRWSDVGFSAPAYSSAGSVAFYCNEYGQSWWPGWGPTAAATAGRGLGGSEEAVLHTAAELASLGHMVMIFADVPAQDVGAVTHQHTSGGRVLWLHHSQFDPTAPGCDVFIAWRYSLSVALGYAAQGTYLWLHDLVPGRILPLSLLDRVGGVLVQSDFHRLYIAQQVSSVHSDFQKQHFAPEEQESAAALLQQRIFVLANGMALDETASTTDESTAPDTTAKFDRNRIFVYGSAPNRGLHLVLLAWPTILAELPGSVLEVYYGFTEAVVRHMRSTMGDAAFEAWHAQMMVLLRQEGVRYLGAVDPTVLSKAYQRAGFLLYPTTFQETGCITAIKAMVHGAIPVTSRLRESVMATLTAPHDLGPTQELNLTTIGDQAKLNRWLMDEWVVAVVRAGRIDSDVLQMHREKMMLDVRERYSWRLTAKTLHNFVFKV